MHPKEKENILKLDPFKRYQHFIKKIADFEELWTIVDENGNYVISEIDSYKLISFWTVEEFIFSNLSDGWEDCKPLKLNLEDLQNELYEIISIENYLINVFPINGNVIFPKNSYDYKCSF